jgi:hypothetical protein
MVRLVTSCFIGVISHEASRFAVSVGVDGLAESLAAALRDIEVPTEVRFRVENDYDAEATPISGALVRRAIRCQFEVERQWLQFLRGSKAARDAAPVFTLRELRARYRYLNLAGTQATPLALRSLQRLINIELSHLTLMRAGLDSSSEWILILEDDAASADVADLATGLKNLFTSQAQERSPLFVNLSRSFSHQELGIRTLLRPIEEASWMGRSQRVIYAASKPITNTVCAVLYRRSFLTQLVRALDEIPLDPVLPIDWKLNLALMRLFDSGKIMAGDCWTIDPAPILQMSMHGQSA